MDAGSYKIEGFFRLSWEQRQPDYFYNGILGYCCMKFLKYKKSTMMNVSLLERYMPCVGGGMSGWAHAGTYMYMGVHVCGSQKLVSALLLSPFPLYFSASWFLTESTE